jgi:hypothetical protein
MPKEGLTPSEYTYIVLLATFILVSATIANAQENDATATAREDSLRESRELLVSLWFHYPHLGEKHVHDFAVQVHAFCQSVLDRYGNGSPAVLVGVPVYDTETGETTDIVPIAFACGDVRAQESNPLNVDYPSLGLQLRTLAEFGRNMIIDGIMRDQAFSRLSDVQFGADFEWGYDIAALADGQLRTVAFDLNNTNLSRPYTVPAMQGELQRILDEQGITVFLPEPHEQVGVEIIELDNVILRLDITHPNDAAYELDFDRTVYRTLTRDQSGVPSLSEVNGHTVLLTEEGEVQLDGDGLATYMTVIPKEPRLYETLGLSVFAAFLVIAAIGFAIKESHRRRRGQNGSIREKSETKVKVLSTEEKQVLIKRVEKLYSMSELFTGDPEVFKAILKECSLVSEELKGQKFFAGIEHEEVRDLAQKLAVFTWGDVTNPNNILNSFVINFVNSVKPDSSVGVEAFNKQLQI